MPRLPAVVGLASRAFREVLCDEHAALPRAHKVEIAVAVEIGDRDLHAAAHTAAVVDQMADPFHLRPSGTAGCGGDLAILIPVHAERLPLARIAAVVRHE